MTSRKPYDIDYLLEEVLTLPSLPSTLSRITQLLNDPVASLSAVSRVVSSDPAIALKTLRLVNSAYYGLRERVASVDHAVVLLGVKVIKNLVVTATVFDTLKSRADAYLRHSIYCAQAMRLLAQSHSAGHAIEAPDEAFIYGLLHDVGKIILEQYLPQEFDEVLKATQDGNTPSYRAEREIIGADHALIGARLAQKWKLPDLLAHAIEGHHDLGQCEVESARPLAGLLAAADYICIACGVPSHCGTVAVVDEALWQASGLRSADIPPLLDQFFASLPQVEELVAIAG